MEIPLLNDIVLIFGLAIVVIYICHKINIPSVVIIDYRRAYRAARFWDG